MKQERGREGRRRDNKEEGQKRKANQEQERQGAERIVKALIQP